MYIEDCVIIVQSKKKTKFGLEVYNELSRFLVQVIIYD